MKTFEIIADASCDLGAKFREEYDVSQERAALCLDTGEEFYSSENPGRS